MTAEASFSLKSVRDWQLFRSGNATRHELEGVEVPFGRDSRGAMLSIITDTRRYFGCRIQPQEFRRCNWSQSAPELIHCPLPFPLIRPFRQLYRGFSRALLHTDRPNLGAGLVQASQAQETLFRCPESIIPTFLIKAPLKAFRLEIGCIAAPAAYPNRVSP